jgi:hypothetical protein
MCLPSTSSPSETVKRRRAVRLLLPAALLLAALLTSCSLQVFALRTIDSVFDNAVAAGMAEPDLQLGKGAMEGNLKLLEAVAISDPTNVKFLLLNCEGYTAYAQAYADDSAERGVLFYGRAEQYGKKALEVRGVPPSVFRADAAAMQAALVQLGRQDVPIVFWTASAWANRVYLQMEDPDALAGLPSINAMMQWVKDRDPGYFYGGPWLYFGTYYSSIPPALGGRPALARENFERAVAASGGRFLMAYVLYARYYAVQAQDEALFTDLLGRVLAAPRDVLPPQSLANAVAKKRAAQLMAEKDTFF